VPDVRGGDGVTTCDHGVPLDRWCDECEAPNLANIGAIFRRHFEGGVTPTTPGAYTWVYQPEDYPPTPARNAAAWIAVGIALLAGLYALILGRVVRRITRG
jgi:hypothetical protein